MVQNVEYVDLVTLEKKVRQVTIDDKTGEITDIRVVTLVEEKEHN